MTKRMMTLWCPDWPVSAATAEAGLPIEDPAAVLAGNVVIACNDAARADRVHRGMRRRDAQARCPELTLLADCPERDARCFEPVLNMVEELCAQVAPIRPGLLALASPARYYGDDRAAAGVLIEHLATIGVLEVRCGSADDLSLPLRLLAGQVPAIAWSCHREVPRPSCRCCRSKCSTTLS